MTNKGVPDWLNSALWSAPSPHAAAEPPVPLPVDDRPTQPLMSSADAHNAQQQQQIRDSSVPENYASACCSDEEDGRSSENSTAPAAAPPAAKDLSRQNQILNEVFNAGIALNF